MPKTGFTLNCRVLRNFCGFVNYLDVSWQALASICIWGAAAGSEPIQLEDRLAIVMRLPAADAQVSYGALQAPERAGDCLNNDTTSATSNRS
jgi:hypothetical protein